MTLVTSLKSFAVRSQKITELMYYPTVIIMIITNVSIGSY